MAGDFFVYDAPKDAEESRVWKNIGYPPVRLGDSKIWTNSARVHEALKKPNDRMNMRAEVEKAMV